jgi:hypothetical protein
MSTAGLSKAKFGRYGNFHESKEAWGHEIDIRERDPDSFERVEGRYVERFLEGIPLVLRYVDVAYARKPPGQFIPRWAIWRPSASASGCALPSRGASSNRGLLLLPTSTCMSLQKRSRRACSPSLRRSANWCLKARPSS